MASTVGKVALGAAMLLTSLAPVAAQQPQAQPQRPAGAGQAQPAAPAPHPGSPAAPSAQTNAPVQTLPTAPMPDSYKLNMMIRTAIIALNQANQTGNYTVLRDLGAMSFRMSNDPSRLAEIFAALRKRQLDLSPVLFFTPKLLAQPQIDQRGILRLAGFFETSPDRVSFDMYYVFELGQWRLFGIGVMSAPPETTASLPTGQAPGGGGKNPAAQSQQQPVAPGASKNAAGEKPAKPATGNAGRIAPRPEVRPGGVPSAAAASPEKSAVENKTTNNVARIRLGTPGTVPPAGPANGESGPAAAPADGGQSEAEAPPPATKEKSQDNFLPFW